MSDTPLRPTTLGWIGIGRMGSALATRLLTADCDLTLFNRTRARAEALSPRGAKLADAPIALADRDIVFTMVAGPRDFEEVTLGPNGVLADPEHAPRIIIDSTTLSVETSQRVRAAAAERGTVLLAAPVSGNPKVVSSGKLTIAVSGPHSAYLEARPFLELLGRSVTYVGEGDGARIVKIAHNLMLGVVTQCMAEIVVLAEANGVSRTSLLAFLNDSVLGSTFTRYKTPAFVNLDYTPTFTPDLLLKDFDLGLSAARSAGVPLPLAAVAQQLVVSLIGHGYTDVDFATLLELQAQSSGLSLTSENQDVSDGLDRPIAV
ncbi:MAG: NAD(P)-dependent oxidoreductase [Actinomycetota bacterium]|nr:NAD(P)-dependent oxidoreductase [Actinomycetota bacterium]MDQ2955550.1 NAD(P)-dependent oxidoreductase [Actinomycetota bacterium]